MKKRILSLLLVVTMLISMFPAYALSTETGTSYVYDLTRLQTGAGATEGVAPISIRAYEDLDALGNYYNRTTDPFKLFNQSGGMTWKWTEESHNGVGPTITGRAGHFGALTIKVGKSALYDIKLKLLDNAAATSLNFYFLPMSVAQTVSGANYPGQYIIGSTNFTETTPTLKDVSFGEQYLEAGEYVLVFMAKTQGEGLTAISRISLDWVSNEKPPESLRFNLGRLQYGRWSGEGVAPSTLTSYEAIDALGNYYNRVSDPFMFYGQSEGFGWTWTASSMGKVDGDGPRGPSIVSEKGQWGGIKIRVEQAAQYNLKVRFANSPNMPSIKFYLAPANAENPRAPEYARGTAVPRSTDVYSVVTESFGNLYLEEGEYAVIFENITGKTEFAGGIAEVLLDFVSFEEPETKSYYYNLARLQTGAGATEGVAPIDIRKWDDLLKLDNYYNRDCDPFILWNQSGGMSWKWTEESHNGVGPTIVGNAGHFGGIVLRVEKSATYDITLKLLDDVTATALKFYFMPISVAQTVSGGNLPGDYTIGSTDFTETTPTLKDVHFGEQYLEAGDYVLAFSSTLRGEGLTAISEIRLDWKSDEKPPKDFCFNLARLQWGRWSSQGNNPSTLTDWDTLNSLGNYYNFTTDPFMFYGQSEGMSWTWTSSSMGHTSYGPRGPSITSAAGEWGGIKIRVDQTALYDVDFRFADTKDLMPSLKLYLAPAGAENPRDEMYYMGTAVPSSEDIYAVRTENFGRRYLPAGDYAVVFENATGITEYAGGIAEVRLNTVSRTPSERLVLSGSVADGVKGESRPLTVSATFDGEEIALEDLDILRVDTVDSEIATLEKTEDGYNVVGAWKGKSTVRVSAEHEGELTAIDIPFEIVLPEGYLEVDLKVQSEAECKKGQSVTVPVTYLANREPIDASEVSISVSVEDESIATVTVNEDGSLAVYGKNGGSTKITVNMEKDGKRASKTLKLAVDPVMHFYSLHNGYQGPYSDSARPLDYFVDYDMYDKNPGGELPMFWTKDTAPWKYIDSSAGLIWEITKSFRSWGYILKGSANDYLHMGIKVPEAGVYEFALRLSGVQAAGLLDLYVSPIGTAKEDLDADRYYVGTVSGTAGSTTHGLLRAAGNVTLEEGEYNVYCVTPEAAVGSNGVYLVGFCLNAPDEHQFRLSNRETAPIMESASGEVPLTALYDGAEISFETVTDMSVVSENESVATATLFYDGATAKLQVDGHTPGNASFVVSATCDGIKTERRVSVRIARKDEVKFITLDAEKKVISAGDTIPTTVSATCFDGTPGSLAGKSIYYESSNSKAVSVNAKGEITAEEKGDAIIRAWAEVDGKTLSGEMLVTVGTHSAIADAKLLFGNTLTVGTQKSTEVSVVLASGTILPKDLYQAEVTILSGDCVTLENGVLTAVTEGEATLQIAVAANEETLYFEKIVTVRPTLKADEDLERLVVKVESPTMSVGETCAITLGAYRVDGTFVPFDPSVMTLTYDQTKLSIENGVVTALDSGECVVTLSTDSLETKTLIKVDEETIASVQASLDGALYPETSASIAVSAYTQSMRELQHKDITVSYVSADESIATVTANGVVTAVTDGDTAITVTVSFGGHEAIAIVPITVRKDSADSIQLTVDSSVMKPDDADGVKIKVSLVSDSGTVTELAVSDLTFVCSDPELLDITEEGVALPKGKLGTATVTATFTLDGRELSSEIELTVKNGKTEATFYTKEKMAAARKNVENYDWAKSVANSFDSQLEYLVGQEEWLAELITSQELPRNLWAAYQYDPLYQNCRYCGTNTTAYTGETYAYKTDNVNYPWKIQCPACMRRFPSNDFGTFYKTGLDEHGIWSYEKAKANGSHLLVNTMYPEMDEHIDKNGVLQNEGVHGWGVDDGYGYKTGKKYDTSYGEWDETWTFIACYNVWGVWGHTGVSGSIARMSRLLGYAYTYSGGAKKQYGQLLAVMLDRIADVYPDLQTEVYTPEMMDNGWYGGKFTGGIWDTGTLNEMIVAYDAVYDLYDDPSVMAIIRKNAEKWNYDNKNTPAEVREHIETNFLLDTKKALENKTIYGNNGMHQKTGVYTGVVLDRMPESKELIDNALTGPEGIMNTMINTVNRDGHGNENSIMYNAGWIGDYSGIADALADYKSYPAANLYQNPKFVKMLTMNLPLTMARRVTLSVGDCYGFGDTTLMLQTTACVNAIMAGCEEPLVAQNLYFMNGNQFNGSAIRSQFLDTDAVAAKLKELIERYGEYDFDKSTQMTGFGIGVLRGGTFRAGGINNINTQRAVALWYGPTYGHGHINSLDLSMYAYGINVMPAFGYPTNTTGVGSVRNWERATISHNTVQVNSVQQSNDYNMPVGEPIHFDDSGRVKLVDARNSKSYPHEGVSEYRRTAIMVEADHESAYTVDLFRIIGGNEHLYSFHSQSNTVAGYEGFDPIYQEMGTYAGPNVPYGPGNIASGYDSFYDVYRSTNPNSKFSLTFKVDDFRGVLKENRDLYLKVTQLNDFELSDVSFASAVPPNIHGNTREIKYLLARRNGKNLDSLFTTVIEPYDKTPLIDDVTAVTVTDRAGNEVKKDVRALKVTLKNGRVDYIVYAADNTVRYRIDDKFDFIGFVGVISYRDGEAIYRYLHDGTMLDSMYGEDAVTGTIESLTDTIAFDNYITIRTEQNIDPNELAGKTIYVNKTTNNNQNGAYGIVGAVKNPNGTYTLDIGDITLVATKSGNSYTTNIKPGETFRIPLTEVDDDSPIVEPIKDQVAMVGDTLNVPIKATSPSGKELTYTLTRSINGATMQGNVFCFTPSAS
ncbi:MAG: Ig-like domain-containing protein, partial [Oscillospiraceae bacterium]|nr:Ig-like domain-containing protein [Oscillospiraceae bacterium]